MSVLCLLCIDRFYCGFIKVFFSVRCFVVWLLCRMQRNRGFTERFLFSWCRERERKRDEIYRQAMLVRSCPPTKHFDICCYGVIAVCKCNEKSIDRFVDELAEKKNKCLWNDAVHSHINRARSFSIYASTPSYFRIYMRYLFLCLFCVLLLRWKNSGFVGSIKINLIFISFRF